MIDLLDNLDNIAPLLGRKIVVYGAGEQGKRCRGLLEAANMPVSFFCDGDAQKHGTRIRDIAVVSPAALQRLDREEDIAIVIAVQAQNLTDEIADTIERLSLRTQSVYTLFGLRAALMLNLGHPMIKDQFRILFSCFERFKSTVADSFYTPYSDALGYMMAPKRLLVYSSMKTGTSSVYNSLNRLGLESSHIHRFRRPEYLMSLFHPHDRGALARIYSDECLDLIRGQNLKIITLFREPIARELSLCFQYMDDRGFDPFLKTGDTLTESCERWIKERAAIISGASKELSPNAISSMAELFSWFDEELKAIFGVDIFSYPFDRERGYTLIRQDNVEILVLKLEMLDKLEGVIGEFVGAPDFKLINANEAGQKPYKYIYKQVRGQIRIPRELASIYYYNNPRMDHFYTEEEKAAFLKKWEKNIE